MFKKIKLIMMLVAMNVVFGPREKILKDEIGASTPSSISLCEAKIKRNMRTIRTIMKSRGYIAPDAPDFDSMKELVLAVKNQNVNDVKKNPMRSYINWSRMKVLKSYRYSPNVRTFNSVKVKKSPFWDSKNLSGLTIRTKRCELDFVLPRTFEDLSEKLQREEIHKIKYATNTLTISCSHFDLDYISPPSMPRDDYPIEGSVILPILAARELKSLILVLASTSLESKKHPGLYSIFLTDTEHDILQVFHLIQHSPTVLN